MVLLIENNVFCHSSCTSIFFFFFFVFYQFINLSKKISKIRLFIPHMQSHSLSQTCETLLKSHMYTSLSTYLFFQKNMYDPLIAIRHCCKILFALLYLNIWETCIVMSITLVRNLFVISIGYNAANTIVPPSFIEHTVLLVTKNIRCIIKIEKKRLKISQDCKFFQVTPRRN